MEAIARTYNSLKSWFFGQIITEKMDSILGYTLLTALALVMAYFISLLDLKYGVIAFAFLLSIPLVGVCMFNQVFGITFILSLAILIGVVTKVIQAPFGTTLDILLFVMFFGLLLKQIRERDFSFAKHPLSAYIIIWVFYNVIQVLNPWAHSQLAWLFTVRSMAGLILLYFIACYAFSSLKSIFQILRFIIFLAFISAAYGLKQEYFGFSSIEMNWLTSDPERFQLIFQWSRVRIFSFFSDPTNFGIFMAYSGTLCWILATGPFKRIQKLFLVAAGSMMFLAMAYAGSRTPFVLVPVGFIFFTILTLKKSHIIGILAFFVLGAGFVMKSTNSAVLYRIQSAFDFTKSDDTVMVRLNNQKKIQPFIYSHPFGGGLGSTGIWGKRFSPDSELSDFAHDSLYVRIAVEAGWIGLIIFCVFYFQVLRTSIYYYLRVRNPKIKVIYLALTIMFFQLGIANYPQEASVILPTSIIFYIALAMIVKLKDFDDGVGNAPYRSKLEDIKLIFDPKVNSSKGISLLKDNVRHKS